MKNELIEIGKEVLSGVITAIVAGFVRKIMKQRKHTEESK